MKKRGKILVCVISIVVIVSVPVFWKFSILDRLRNQGIVISNENELKKYACGGDGSSGDPYIIEDIHIDYYLDYGIKFEDIYSHVIIRSCSIRNGKNFQLLYSSSIYGILLHNCSGFEITDTVVETSPGGGIGVRYSSEIDIHNVVCHDTEIGINIGSSNAITVKNNTVRNCVTGISVFLSGIYEISHNLCENNNYGIKQLLSDYDIGLVENNNCSNNRYFGIWSEACDYLTLRNNTCRNNPTGIYLSNTRATVEKNELYNNFNGILGINIENSELINNSCFDCDLGISIRYSTIFTIQNNFFVNCSLFILNEPSAADIDISNKVNGKSVHYYRNQHNLVFSNHTDLGQLILNDCDNCTIENQVFSEGIDAIYLSDSSNTTIQNCSFVHSRTGIRLSNSDNNKILNNSFLSNQIAIENYMWSVNNSLIGNNATGCGIVNYDPSIHIHSSNLVNGKPIVFYHNQNNLTIENIDSIGQLILLTCNSAIIKNLNISNTSYGIFLAFCSYCEITGCLLEYNQKGIFLEYFTEYCTIWNNTFIQNKIHAEAISKHNFWDKNNIGNYWDDYKAKYPDGKVIETGLEWDMPYLVYIEDPYKEYDNHPLASPFSTNNDNDNDGIWDSIEIHNYGTDPSTNDSDGDGMDEKWEIENGLNPLVNDAMEDPDRDGRKNIDEYNRNSNPHFSIVNVILCGMMIIVVIGFPVLTIRMLRRKK